MPEIEIPVRGTYEVQEGMVTVVYRGRKKSAEVGGSLPETIARLVLRELVEGPSGIGSTPDISTHRLA